MLYIVASMDSELYGLQRELEARGESRPVGFPVERHLLGVGPRRSGAALEAVLGDAKRRPEGILMLGVAGALDPGMETGGLVVAESYVLDAEEGVDNIAPDSEMMELAETAAAGLRMPVSRGRSLTVDRLISNSRERRQLRERYGTSSVNMEDHAVATAAGTAGVPFLSVRVILDTARQRLPGYLPGLSKGRSAIFTEVVLKPWRIPTLIKLRSQMDLCESVLARFGISYLEREAERRRSFREQEAAEALY